MTRAMNLKKRIELLTGSSVEAEALNREAADRAEAEFMYDNLLGLTVQEEKALKALQKLGKRTPLVPREEYLRKRRRRDEILDKFIARTVTPQERDEYHSLVAWLWQVEYESRETCRDCGRSNWDLTPQGQRIKVYPISQPHPTTANLCESCFNALGEQRAAAEPASAWERFRTERMQNWR